MKKGQCTAGTTSSDAAMSWFTTTVIIFFAPVSNVEKFHLGKGVRNSIDRFRTEKLALWHHQMRAHCQLLKIHDAHDVASIFYSRPHHRACHMTRAIANHDDKPVRDQHQKLSLSEALWWAKPSYASKKNCINRKCLEAPSPNLERGHEEA